MLLLIAEKALGFAPAPVHRMALRLAHRVRRLWWRWKKPATQGCRALAIDAQGRVLLVRHSYGSGHWLLPGGGIKPGEDPIIAAAREIREEINVALHAPRIVASTHDTSHGAGNASYVIAGLCVGTPKPDGREIIEAAFFVPGAWPRDMPERLQRQIAGWLKG